MLMSVVAFCSRRLSKSPELAHSPCRKPWGRFSSHIATRLTLSPANFRTCLFLFQLALLALAVCQAIKSAHIEKGGGDTRDGPSTHRPPPHGPWWGTA